MRNTYKIEIWQYHKVVEHKRFTSKKKAQEWLKNSGWFLCWDEGLCAIYVYKNNIEIDFDEEEGWRDL